MKVGRVFLVSSYSHILILYVLINPVSSLVASPVNLQHAAKAPLPSWALSWLRITLSGPPAVDKIMDMIPAHVREALDAPMCAKASALAKAGAGSAHAASSHLAQGFAYLMMLAPMPMEPHLAHLLSLQVRRIG